MKNAKWLLILFVTFIVSCDKSDEPGIDSNEKLVSVTYVGEYKKTDILNRAQQELGAAASIVAFLLQYDVKYYKVSYKTTTTDGKEVQASGALMLPVTSTSLPLVSLQHGTLFNEADAPSYFRGSTELMGVVLAAAGYHAIMPDFLGYGDSKAEPHPYEHAEGLAVPNVDLLFAIKEYFKQEEVSWNNSLFLAGYSAGGYATLAMQKLIEDKYSSDFNLKVSSCGAGAYAKSVLLDELITKPSNGQVAHNRSYIWVLLTYNRIHGLGKEVKDIFKEPYASQITANGYNVNISGSFNSLLTTQFIESYKNGNETKVVEAFKKNDLVNWKSNIITYLIHGTADTYVPFVSSSAAYNGMKSAGSTKVVLEPINNGTHESSIIEYILKTYTYFANNKN